LNKRLTIIVPCYNAESYIEDCLISALEQEYNNCEVIFVDNDSSDDSADIAEALTEKYPDLITDSAPNIYAFSYQEPVERALTHATGDYVTILGADDIIDKKYAKKLMKIIESHTSEILAIQSPLRGIDDKGCPISRDIHHNYSNIEDFKNQMLSKCVVTTPTFTFKRELYTKGILQWNSKEYLGAIDYDLYFRLADQGIFIYPHQEWLGYHYRWHKSQATWGMHEQNINYDFKLQNHWGEKWKS
jgi:glycosyltransferase involved in cell wall biosynthesis